jgi:hypothetical protein
LSSAAIKTHPGHPLHSSKAPEGYTGATSGVYCNNCHSGNPLNNSGGSVITTGLPSGTYAAGMRYDFSIITTHSTADRKKWGFSIAARNSLNQPVGTFSTTNPNAAINGSELSHLGAVATGLQSSYTYTDLTWTAPASPGTNDQNITFYYVANAANGTFSNAGDFIYASKTAVTFFQQYSFIGNGNWDDPLNWSNNMIPPSTLTDNAEIVIDPPLDGECVLNIVQHIGNNSILTVKTGKKFRITGNLQINK